MGNKGRPFGSVRKSKDQKAVVIAISLHKSVLDRLDKKVFLMSSLMNKKQSRSSIIEKILINELEGD